MDNSTSQLSRRDFLRTASFAGAAFAVSTSVIGSGEGLLEAITPAEAQAAAAEEEKRYTNCTTGGPCFAYVKNGRIVRTEGIWYTEQEARQGQIPWKVSVGGKTYSSPLKSPPNLWGQIPRKWVYEPTRGRYPMKRVDWDPKGERNPQNRGKSEYVRITWAEAYDIIASELKRIDQTYGRSAVLLTSAAHNEWGSLHYSMSHNARFWNMTGGNTTKTTIPISWEGWAYGPSFMYGYNWAHGTPTQANVFFDVLQESKQIVLWGTDPLTILTYGGFGSALPWPWFRELGKKIVAVNPMLSYTAFFADKWIPVIPGTDAALAAAIAHVWITEGTYDKEFLDTHTIGFDEKTLPPGAPANGSFKSYILGEQDGVPKTPEWAEKITGVKAKETRALAREWASTPTCLLCIYSGACRMAYDYEWARMMVTLQAMQGLGKPGVNMWSSRTYSAADTRVAGLPGYADGGMNKVAKKAYPNPVKQVITAAYLGEAILNPPVRWTGGMAVGGDVRDAFKEFVYPMPGNSEIKAVYQYGASNLHVMADINHWIRIYQSPKIEFVAVQAPWFESDCTYSDIFLPVCSPFERNDVSEAGKTGTYVEPMVFYPRVAVFQQKCIEPLWESKSDMDVYIDLAGRLGMKEAFTEGNTEDDWCRKIFETSKIPMTYEEFKKKGYYAYPFPSDFWEKVYVPQFRWYYNKPPNADFVKEGLKTPTGKIEIFSTTLFKQYGSEDLRAGIAPIPKYRESWEGRKTRPLVDKYPLQLLTPHPRYRYHGKYAQLRSLRALTGCKVRAADGREYEPVLMNPADAKPRGLKDGSVVRVFNNRGQILCGVQLTGKMVTGAVAIAYGEWPDLVERAKPGSLDRAGNSNFLTPNSPPRGVQEHSCNQAFNTALVQVERWVA